VPRIFSVQVDEETGHKVDHDREALKQATGEEVSVSQYLRLLIDQRLHGGAHDPFEAGWGEGFRVGTGEFKRAFETFLQQYILSHKDGEIPGED
jgi:hypothetical protein